GEGGGDLPRPNGGGGRPAGAQPWLALWRRTGLRGSECGQPLKPGRHRAERCQSGRTGAGSFVDVTLNWWFPWASLLGLFDRDITPELISMVSGRTDDPNDGTPAAGDRH